MTIQSGESQIRAEIDRISFRNEENGWTVLRARNCDDNATISATGHFPAIRVGEMYQLIGTWSNHATYGPQFKIERSLPVRPNTIGTMERYLASGIIKGIGEKTAAKIVSHFGQDTFAILDENPACLSQVKGISRKKAQAIILSWQEQKSVADVMMFLNTHGISPLFAQRIYKLYGNEAIELVSADPYRLAVDVHGIGFLSADRIAQSMGIAKDSPERIRAAISWQLQQGEERGHCFLTAPQLKSGLAETLGLPVGEFEARLDKCIKELNKSGAVISESIGDQDPNSPTHDIGHYRAELLISEVNVAAGIARLLKEPLEVDHIRVDRWLQRYSEATGTPLSDAQVAAVRHAANSRVFVLTGGPGVGKTTTANAIIRLLKAMGKTVALAAPTGRAAQRLSEVAAEKAKTIHRLLEWNPAVGGFVRTQHNPMEADVVIIDEASMLDIKLADALVSAVPSKAQLIFIGDVDQLPSVGPGNVLRDLIDSGLVPCTRLDQIFRQAASSLIIRTAHAINQGLSPEFSLEDHSDCRFIEVETTDDIRHTIHELVARDVPGKFGFDSTRDIQILTPMNRGELGTLQTNIDLQNLLNPARKGRPEFKSGGTVFRTGDKVIQIVNNYDLGVFNGDVGFVTNVNVEGGTMPVVFGDGRTVSYTNETANELRLAYAITIHKSQGSEFPVVIIPVSMQHYIMLQRNLIYTALTRSRKLAIFVGSKKALAQAIRTQTSTKRQTMLIERMRRANS